MKLLPTHQALGLDNAEDSFEFFLDTLSEGLRDWDYFVNWDKVIRNTQEIEIDLNLWNYLLGKPNFDEEFRALVGQHPQIVRTIPSLLVRSGNNSKSFNILTSQDDRSDSKSFDFSKPASTAQLIEDALEFVRQSGLWRIFAEDGVKNLVDYFLGVEAGLDSNGRKNRGGSAMEKLVERFIAKSCKEAGFEYLAEVTPAAADNEWGVKSLYPFEGRRFDFVIRTATKLIPIETNFYGGGGSKLKSVAGEFIELEQRMKSRNLDLIWLTDGPGWLTTKGPLRKAYLAMDFVMNIKLMEKGMLHDILQPK